MILTVGKKDPAKSPHLRFPFSCVKEQEVYKPSQHLALPCLGFRNGVWGANLWVTCFLLRGKFQVTYGDSRKGRWRLSLTPALGLFGSEVWFHHRSYFKMPGSSILLGPIPALSTCTLCSPLPHTRRPCLSAVSLQPEVLNSQSGVWVYVLDPHRDICSFMCLLVCFYFTSERPGPC